jgi:hypothetical protein
MSWSRTAGKAFTGTLTSPKLITPLHTARAMRNSYPEEAAPITRIG